MEHNENMNIGEETGFTDTEFKGSGPFDGGEDNNISGEGGEQDGKTAQEETTEKAKRKPRKKKENSADVLPEGEEQYVGPDDEEDGEGRENMDESGYEGEASHESDEYVPEEARPGNVTTARRKRTSQRRPVVLDSSGNIIQERADSGQHDLSILTAARNRRKILTATVDAIETDGEQLPRVVFYVGTVKVMIPFSQMGFDLDPETITQREARLLVDSMLGAVIDYAVVGVDTDARLAGASRRSAMLLRQSTILNARSARGNSFRINEGMRVMARILHVSQNVLRVEVFGFETWLRIPDISNIWVNDIREVVKVGEERPVEIVSLKRDEHGKVTSMRVSMKAAEDAPQLELRAGNTYTGHILNFSDKAYYVRVAGVQVDIRCPINSNYTLELMEVGDFVKFYIRAIYDGVPTGAILKIIKKKVATGI